MGIGPYGGPFPRIDLDRPNVARVYDYFLGGAHNLRADRDAADAVIAVAPQIVDAARANRTFLRRAVRYALAQGVRQFLDLGAGLLTVGNVHGIAHAVDPSTRVVYVDVDPVVVAHTRATVRDLDTVGVVRADIRGTVAVLEHPETRRLIDFDEPVAVLAVAVLQFVPGDIAALLAALRQPMAPGSQLVISHPTMTASTPQTDAVAKLYAQAAMPIHLRTPQQIRGLLAGLDLVHPTPGSRRPAGLVPVTGWRPELDSPSPPADTCGSSLLTGVLAAIGRASATPSATTDMEMPRC